MHGCSWWRVSNAAHPARGLLKAIGLTSSAPPWLRREREMKGLRDLVKEDREG